MMEFACGFMVGVLAACVMFAFGRFARDSETQASGYCGQVVRYSQARIIPPKGGSGTAPPKNKET